MPEKDLNAAVAPDVNFGGDKDVALGDGSIAATPKSRWERSWPVIACGSGMKSTLLNTGLVETNGVF